MVTFQYMLKTYGVHNTIIWTISFEETRLARLPQLFQQSNKFFVTLFLGFFIGSSQKPNTK